VGTDTAGLVAAAGGFGS